MILEAKAPANQTDLEAREALRLGYLDEIYAYASRRLARREDAEDAAAETFRAAFANLHRMPKGDVRLWLFGIARRKVADLYRKERRRREVALTDDLAVTEGQSLESREAAANIRRIVYSLPDNQREALLLQYLEGLSHAEIAFVIGRSPTAVNSLIQRARARVYRDGRAYFLEEGSR
jgi:RNA polymerase sigma-70 factor (ECF subfamily)